MTMIRVVKNDDYKYVYKAEVKYDWFPFWLSIKIGSKEELIEYAQACVQAGKIIKNVVVYQTAIN